MDEFCKNSYPLDQPASFCNFRFHPISHMDGPMEFLSQAGHIFAKNQSCDDPCFQFHPVRPFLKLMDQ